MNLIGICRIAALIVISSGPAAEAQEYFLQHAEELASAYMSAPTPSPRMSLALRAKALPDECFTAVGGQIIPMPENGVCPEDTRSKTNQAYLWGMARVQDRLWFGTGPNVICLIAEQILQLTEALQTDDFVCEFGNSQWPTHDHRPPRIYFYDTIEARLEDVTPSDSALAQGIRAAGALDDVVFLAGPGVDPTVPGIVMFAFDPLKKTYLGSHTFTEYSDIRDWVVLSGKLYAAVQSTSNGRGKVLRWGGDLSNLWSFSEVADLPTQAAHIAVYDRTRLAVSTWPSTKTGTKVAGIFISPRAPKSGLTPRHRRSWKKVFSFLKYEPDPIVARTYAGGPLTYYKGWLYWGTMHVPAAPARVMRDYLAGINAQTPDFADALMGTWRATSLWRGRKLHATTKPTIQLLYGERELARYNPLTQSFAPASTGWKPKYGKSGYGNPLNTYTWDMEIADGSLFIGTLDLSYLLSRGIGSISFLPPVAREYPIPPGDPGGYGADIWRIDSKNSPAKLENAAGAGTAENYGFRTMVASADGRTLFVGSANPLNLSPAGGWELIEMQPAL